MKTSANRVAGKRCGAQRPGRTLRLVGFLRVFAATEQGEGAFAGALHYLLVLSNGLELLGDVGQVGGAATLDRVLQGFQFGIEAEAVMLNFHVETPAEFDGECDGAQIIGEALEGRIGGPDEGAGTLAVRAGIGKGTVTGEGKVALMAVAIRSEEAVGAGVLKEAGAEAFVDADGAIYGGGKDVVILLGDAGLGDEMGGAIFLKGDGVTGGLKLRVLKGVDDAGRGLRRQRCGGEKRDDEREQGRMKTHG